MPLPPEHSLPAVGQDPLVLNVVLMAIIHNILVPLHHYDTAVCIQAERTANNRLEDSCQVPIASFTILQDKYISYEIKS